MTAGSERPPVSGLRIGVLGGGQLARMLGLAGHPAGVPLSVSRSGAGRLRRGNG